MSNNPHNHDEYNVRFFKYLDTPTMIIIFEADEFLLGLFVYLTSMIMAALLGIVLPGGVMLYALVAILTMLFYIKYKKNKPDGYLLSKFYRYGIIDARTFNYKRKLTKEEKKFKVLPYGFLNDIRGN